LGTVCSVYSDNVIYVVFTPRRRRLWYSDPADDEGSRRDTSPTGLSELILWIYELLDAHGDTARLAAELDSQPEWQAHLAYLRDLQRRGREALARAHARSPESDPVDTKNAVGLIPATPQSSTRPPLVSD
jgi:hypothetical protein